MVYSITKYQRGEYKMALGDRKELLTKEALSGLIFTRTESDARFSPLMGSQYNQFSCQNPSSGKHAVNRDYANSNYAYKTGSTGQPFYVALTPSHSYHATTKNYVDGKYNSAISHANSVKTTVYNGLNSTSSTYALSAAQGNVLAGRQNVYQVQTMYVTYGSFANKSLLIGNMQFTTTGNNYFPCYFKMLRWGGHKVNVAGTQLGKQFWNEDSRLTAANHSMYSSSWVNFTQDKYGVNAAYQHCEVDMWCRGNTSNSERYRITMSADGSSGVQITAEYWNGTRRTV